MQPGNTYPEHVYAHVHAHGFEPETPPMRLTWRQRLGTGMLMGMLIALAWILIVCEALMQGVMRVRVRLARDIAAARSRCPEPAPMSRGELWGNVIIFVLGFSVAVGLYVLHLVQR